MLLSGRKLGPALLVMLSWLATGGCKDDETHPPPGRCTVGCVNPPVGGGAEGGAGGTGAGGSGTGGAATVTGNVRLLVDGSFGFVDDTNYTGQATVEAREPGGTLIASDDWDGEGFELSEVPFGDLWFRVVDGTAFEDVLSTFSPQTVPTTSDFVLPLMDQTLFESVVLASYSGFVQVDPTATHLVLFMERSGVPLPGVRLVAAPAGGLVAYDDGFGIYSDALATTGVGGIILVTNAAPMTGLVELLVEDEGLVQFSILVQVAPGTVTRARYELAP